jgi:4-carboxymuconolactone decarboxylase
MAISETAQKNHDELFPGRVSTLTVTDPELIEVFDNFAFDEVLSSVGLDTRTRLMVQLAALIGCQALSEYRVMLGAALTAGVTPVEAKEIVYQSVPYAGMGKVFDFIAVTNDVLTERGVQLPLEGQSTTTPATRADKGRAVQERIAGADRVAGMYASAAEDEQRFQRFLSANCFGDYLTRAGIDLPVRELLTFALLAALGGCDPQVKGHVAANLNVGNGRQTLLGVLTVLVPFIGYPRTLNALAAVNEVAPAANRGTGSSPVLAALRARELADQLLERGDTVVGAVRQADSVADPLRKYSDMFRRELLDVTDGAAVRDAVGRSFGSLRRVDVVVSESALMSSRVVRWRCAAGLRGTRCVGRRSRVRRFGSL